MAALPPCGRGGLETLSKTFWKEETIPLDRRRFLTALALGAALGKNVSATGLGDADWRKRRLALADRRRRIIYNDDGDARYKGYYGPAPKDVADFLRRRFKAIAGGTWRWKLSPGRLRIAKTISGARFHRARHVENVPHGQLATVISSTRLGSRQRHSSGADSRSPGPSCLCTSVATPRISCVSYSYTNVPLSLLSFVSLRVTNLQKLVLTAMILNGVA